MKVPLATIPPLQKRRTVVSDGATCEIPLALHDTSPLPELELSKPPQAIEDRQGEIQRVSKRLLAIIEDHRISAARMTIKLDSAVIDQVLLALEAETRGDDPAVFLADPDEIRSYVLTSLYEDLLAEPSNILFTTQVSAEVVRYEAMEAAFWKECVAALRRKLIPSQLT